MINKIYELIKNNKGVAFYDIKKQNKNIDNNELSKILKDMEEKKQIISYKNNYYDLLNANQKDGYVQYDLNGYSWLSEQDDSNKYGISVNENINNNSIINKKFAFYGSFVTAKELIIDEKKYYFITHSYDTKPINVLALKNNDNWIILNTPNGFSFKNNNGDKVKDGIIYEFIYKDKEFHQNKIFELNINNYGFESELIKTLCELKNEDYFNEIRNNENLKLSNDFYFTIDGVETKDIDDAISVSENEKNYILKVAIANVSKYIVENSNEDVLASKRGVTYYLPHQTINMLNKKFAENYLSLNVGKERDVMVCEMIIDKETNKIIKSNFYEDVIISKARLSYKDVNSILENKEPVESYEYSLKKVLPLTSKNLIIKENLNLLKKIVSFQNVGNKILNEIEYPDMVLGKDGKIEELIFKSNSESQRMIEVSMLLANIQAAEKIIKTYDKKGLFRNQSQPKEKNMLPAFYGNENEGHWGLQEDCYAHFTSPIRRYGDILVHRMLRGNIENNVEDVIKIINKSHCLSKQMQLRTKNILINEYVEKLNKNNALNNEMVIIGHNDNGIILRNKQNIDFFIPLFKIDKDLKKDLLNPDNNLEFINKKWKIKIKVIGFNWFDDKKMINCDFFNLNRECEESDDRATKKTIRK